jgi:aspartyl aminopeptidase
MLAGILPKKHSDIINIEVNILNDKEIEQFRKSALKKTTLALDGMDPADSVEMDQMAQTYKTFLNGAKTERRAVSYMVNQARQTGFTDLTAQAAGSPWGKNKKYYTILKNKALAMVVTGDQPLELGLHIIGSHIDSPRLDLKQNPLYEDTDLALLKTHYYGGIRKYQWLSIPLALHGVVVKADGTMVDINIGDDANDPVFVVSDLLPHLAGKAQESKKLSEAFDGEKLNLIAGSVPLGGEGVKERFKLGVLKLLHEQYGICEEDFVSAEIEAVPAGKARDIGFDRSMIGGYGQDDRICAWAAFQAMLALDKPQQTCVALFYDKEEIGSEGNTGAQSTFLESVVSDLFYLQQGTHDERQLRKILHNAKALSADVNAAMDPDFKEVHESMNAARLGHGVCITKFTGARGKAGSSDAGAEFVGLVRRCFNENKVVWQTGELGKIDEGGGGTIAKFLAHTGMDVLDCGPALLSMHAPFEISSKADFFMTFRAYKSFFEWSA